MFHLFCSDEFLNNSVTNGHASIILVVLRGLCLSDKTKIYADNAP